MPIGALLLGVVASVLVPAGTASAAAPLPSAPDNIVVFPDRDMVVLEGYEDRDGQPVEVHVLRDGRLMGAAKGQITAGAEFEVNHPGGACWGNDPAFPRVTPDLRAGDVVEVRFSDGGTSFAHSESRVLGGGVTETGDKGIAISGNGAVLTVTGTVDPAVPAENMEQRIVNPALTDTRVARRDMRAVVTEGNVLEAAPKGGYSSKLEVAGGGFTATYDFRIDAAGTIPQAEAAATLATALEGGDVRLMSWQQTDGAANRQGLTIAQRDEFDGPGFAGCPTGPDGASPDSGSYAVAWDTDGTTAQVNWTPATSQPGAPQITGYSVLAVQRTATDGEQATIGKRTGATAGRATLSGLTGGSGAWDIEVRPLTGGVVGAAFPPSSGTGTGGNPGPGDATDPTVQAQQTAGSVTLTMDEPGDIYWTTGTTPVLEGGGLPSATATLYTAPIAITAPTTLNWVGLDLAGNRSVVGTGTYQPAPAPEAAPPGAPAGLRAVPSVVDGIGRVEVSWTAPAETGNRDLTGYTVTTRSGTTVVGEPLTVSGAPPATTATVTGLTVGSTYTVSVTATNAAGLTGPAVSVETRAGDQLTASIARNKARDVRLAGSGSQSGVAVRVYRTSSLAGVGDTDPSVSRDLGAAEVVPATAPAVGIGWELRLRNEPVLPRGTVIWARSTGGGIAYAMVP